MTALFLSLSVLLILGTALALAGKWQPQGLSEEDAATRPHDGPPRLDVALRGYRMDQVDAEIARLHALLGEQSDRASGARQGPAEDV